MTRLWVALALSGCLGSAGAAATVYEQPGSLSCVPECSTSHSAGFFIRTSDNFTLSADAAVSKVSWQGIYFKLLQQFGDPAPLPSTTSWQLDFYNDAGGAPGTLLSSSTLPAASVTTTLLGTGLGPIGIGAYNVNYYAFSADLPESFNAVADTPYWFSPLSLASDFSVFFLWSPSTLAYDGASWRSGTGGAPQPLRADYSFALGAAPGVPEPASWALLIVGFGAVGLASRRQRVAA